MPASPHRKTVVSGGLLCCALILVVLFTSPAAFRSPAAIVVMVLIGTAAVLAQSRFRHSSEPGLPRPALWLNFLGILFALAALFPAAWHLGVALVRAMAFAAVGTFAISSAITLHSFRKQPAKPE
jgi:hypothetical protein